MKRREFLGATAAAPLAAVAILPNKVENPNNFPVVQFGEPKNIKMAGAFRQMPPVLNAKEIFANADWEGGFKFAHAWVNECDAVFNGGPGGFYPVRVIWGELRLSLCYSGMIYFDPVESTGQRIEEAKVKEVKRACGYYPDPLGCGYYPDPNGNNIRLTFYDQSSFTRQWNGSGLPIIKLVPCEDKPDFFTIKNAKEIFDGVEWEEAHCGWGVAKRSRAILKSQDAIIRDGCHVWGEMRITLYVDGSIYISPSEQSVKINYFGGFTINKELAKT